MQRCQHVPNKTPTSSMLLPRAPSLMGWYCVVLEFALDRLIFANRWTRELIGGKFLGHYTMPVHQSLCLWRSIADWEAVQMNEFCETTDYHNCPSATDEERLVNAFVSSMPGTPFHNCRQGCEHCSFQDESYRYFITMVAAYTLWNETLNSILSIHSLSPE